MVVYQPNAAETSTGEPMGGRGRAYASPIPKMLLTATFLPMDNLRRQRIGMGMTTTATSRARFRIPIDMAMFFPGLHMPPLTEGLKG